MAYVSGLDEKGDAIDVRDPLAKDFATRASTAGRDPVALAAALLGIASIFGADLPREAQFTAAIERHLAMLFDKGAKATAAAFPLEWRRGVPLAKPLDRALSSAARCGHEAVCHPCLLSIVSACSPLRPLPSHASSFRISGTPKSGSTGPSPARRASCAF